MSYPNDPNQQQNPYGQQPQGQYPPPQGQYPPPQGQYPPPQGQYPPPYGQQQFGAYAPPPKKKGGLLKLILIIGALLVVGCAGAFFFLFNAARSAQAESEKVVTQFMQAGVSENVSGGANLTAPSYIDGDAVEGLFSQRALFEGFQSITTDSDSVSYNSDTTNGTVFSFKGKVAYSDDPQGTFDAQLVKEGDAWKIRYINVQRQ